MPERVVWLRSCSGTSRVRGLVSTIASSVTIVSSVRAYPLGTWSMGERRGGPVRVDAALGQVGDEVRVGGECVGHGQLEAFGGERLHLCQQARATLRVARARGPGPRIVLLHGRPPGRAAPGRPRPP